MPREVTKLQRPVSAYLRENVHYTLDLKEAKALLISCTPDQHETESQLRRCQRDVNASLAFGLLVDKLRADLVARSPNNSAFAATVRQNESEAVG